MYSPHMPYDPTWTRAQFCEWMRSYAATPDHDIVFMGIRMVGYYDPSYIWECKNAAHGMLRGARFPPMMEKAIMYFACARLRQGILESQARGLAGR